MKACFLAAVYLLILVPADAQWTHLPSPLPSMGSKIVSLVYYDNVLFASVDGSGIYLSADSGVTWTPSNIGIAPSALYLTLCVHDSTLYAGDFNSAIIYTSLDTGKSWQVFSNRHSDLHVIEYLFADDSCIFALGNENTVDLLGISRDHGNTWTFDSSFNAAVGQVTGTDTALYLLSSNGYPVADILKSTDEGRTWNFIASDTTSSDGLGNISSLSIIDAKIFITRGNWVFRLNEEGAWDRLPDSLDNNITAATVGTSVTSQMGKNLTVKDESSYYAGTDHGSLFQYPLSHMVTAVQESKDQRPASYVLNQNYPNPFNPSTVITYQSPVNSLVTLRVYDEIGRQVGTLVSDNQTAGTHSVIFNASNLSSGVYFYRLSAGSFVQTKKLMLLK